KKAWIKAFAQKYIKVIPALCAIPPLPFKLYVKGTYVRDITNVLFEGGEGSGKSLLASIIAQSAIKKALSVQYYDWLHLKLNLKDYSQKEEHASINYHFNHSDLLIIDNIQGVDEDENKLGAYLSDQLDYIFMTRSNNNKPTILVSDGS